MKQAIKTILFGLVESVGFLVLAVVALYITSRKDPSVIWQFVDFLELSNEHGEVMAGFVLTWSCLLSALFSFVGFLMEFCVEMFVNPRNKSGDK